MSYTHEFHELLQNIEWIKSRMNTKTIWWKGKPIQKPATIEQIHSRGNRAQMRDYAMSFRSHIHPNTLDCFSERCERAAHYIKMAMDYRDMAKQWER